MPYHDRQSIMRGKAILLQSQFLSTVNSFKPIASFQRPDVTACFMSSIDKCLRGVDKYPYQSKPQTTSRIPKPSSHQHFSSHSSSNASPAITPFFQTAVERLARNPTTRPLPTKVTGFQAHSRQLTTCSPSSPIMLTQSTSSLPPSTPSLLSSPLRISCLS